MNRITKPTLLALAASGALTLGGLSLANVGSAASTDRAAQSNVAVTPTDPTDPTTPVTVGDTGTGDSTTDPAAPASPVNADEHPGRGGPGQGRHGGDCEPGQGGADHGADRRGGAMLDAVAEAIGIDVADLRTALADGQTIAEVATANGVEPDAVIDAIVAVRAERLADAVANGRLTQEEADARLAEQTAKIEAHVNGTDDAATTA